MSHLIGKTISHYRIIDQIGQGGMGVVYKAFDTKLERIVALKLLRPETMGDPEAKKRFIREARAASALNHPNITTIYEIGDWHGRDFICMEYLEGQTIKAKVKSKPLPLEDVLNIAIQMAEALQEAHNNDIVHRDIKSENIMITPNGQVKLMDFGLAKLKGTTTLTRDGSTMGTIAYMSPEQTQGENVDQRTDIWSFGVVLYEMIAGQLPFKGDYDQAVIYSILNEEPRPMASLRDGVPLELERIANKCLKKRADERYQQVVEFARDLRQASDPNPPKKTVRIHPKKYGSRFRAKALMPVAGTLVIFIALISFLLSEKFDLNDARRDKKPIMLAVLPFDNLGNPEDAAFADGITDEILTKLSTIPELGVIARESAFKYRGDENTIEEIGEQLGVSYLLRGSIRWQRISEGNSRVRITSRLVSISENRNIWTGNL